MEKNMAVLSLFQDYLVPGTAWRTPAKRFEMPT
jgi:hypothetical protein